jgi:hypothetical protein
MFIGRRRLRGQSKVWFHMLSRIPVPVRAVELAPPLSNKSNGVSCGVLDAFPHEHAGACVTQ